MGTKSTKPEGWTVQQWGEGQCTPLSPCRPALTLSMIFQLLEENDQLIRCIVEYQNKGRANECVQ